MDISGLSMSMPADRINTGLEMVLLSKVLDTAEETGEALEEMMSSVPAVPGLGENIDLRV
ncbi:MAG TPA: putative motility protein [Lachnospiraceae bacterium]|nr:putative motility protein [Lachnospiraceae bacterium]